MTVHNAATPRSTLIAAIWPAEERFGWLRAVCLVVVGSFLMALASKLSLPIGPVAISMQTFAVLVIGMAYGARLAGATVLVYLLEGLAGLPVFAEPLAGPAVFAGPTAGYLIGFLFAAVAVGWLAERGWDRRLPTLIAALLIGIVLIYVPGLLWLGIVFMPDLQSTLVVGLTPFLVGDALKLILAAIVLPTAWHLVGRRRG